MLSSYKILPLEKRGNASKESLLSALEAAEKELLAFKSGYIAKHFVSMRDKLDSLRKEIELTGDVLQAEDKVYDRIMKYYDLIGDFMDTLEAMEKKITPEDLKAAESKVDIVSLAKSSNGKGK